MSSPFLISKKIWVFLLVPLAVQGQMMMDPKVLPPSLLPGQNIDIETLIDRAAAGESVIMTDPAPQTNMWNLNDVINMAAANNKAIQQAKKEMDSSKALYTGSVQDFYVPNLSVGASLSLNQPFNPPQNSFGSAGSNSFGSSSRDPVFNASLPTLQLTWRAFNGMSTWYAHKMALVNHQNAALTYTNSVRSNVYDAVVRYYEQFLREEAVRVMLENLSLLREQMRNAEIQFRNGRISDLDLNTSRANYYNALPNYYQAEQARIFAREDFYRFLGYMPNGGAAVFLQGSLFDVTNVAFAAFDEEESLAYIYTNDTALATLRTSLSNAVNNKGQINAKRLPTIDLEAHFSPNYGSDVTIPTFGNADYRGNLGASATLTVPILSWIPGTGLASQVKSAEIKRQGAEIALADAQEKKLTEVKNTLLNIRQISLSVDALRISEDTAGKAAAAARIQYNNGRISLIDYNQILQNYLTSRQSLLSMIYNDLSARLGLQQAIQPLSGFIGEINRIQPINLDER